MKNQDSLFIIFFVLLFSFSAKAQTRFDVGLEFLPSLSKIYNKSNSDYQFLYPVNYGVRFAVRHNKFIYSTGVLHFTQGSKLIIEIVDEGNPEGGTGNATFYIRAKSIMVPLNAEYIFVSNKKIEFSGGLGLYLGYIYSQQFENPLAEDQSGGIILPPFERFTDIDMFDDFYIGGNMGLSLRIFFNEKLSLLLRPNYLYQFRKKLENDDITGTPRLSSLSLEIGLFYSFGTKGKKEKEDSTTPEIP